MSLLPIHLLGSPVLREESKLVGEVDDELRKLVADMTETMRAASGIGLAANQIGLAKRVAIVEVEKGDRVVLIDPVITAKAGKQRGEEGCLSIPEIYADVDRAMDITFETTTLEGKRVTLQATELTSRAVQHEIDHLDGVLFLDHLSPLKRKMLMKKWKKSRKGKEGYVEEVQEAGTGR